MLTFKKMTFFTTCLILTLPIYGADLLDVYELSQKNDPSYLQEKATYRAKLESRPQALSQLLPKIHFSADTTRYNQNIASEGAFGSVGTVNYNNRGYKLSLTQPLYRRDRFIALDQADSKIKQAEAELARAQQELIIRIATRYFDVLASMDNLTFSQAEVNALEGRLKQIHQRFDVGLSTITDVTEAQAGYDLAIARKIQAQNTIHNAYEAMQELTGEYITHFYKLGNNVPLIHPDPDRIESWTETAMQQNMIISAANFSVETARQEIVRQKAGRYPTLDLIASHGYVSSGGRFGTTETDTSAVGLELNMPIYSGGLLSSQIRKAHEDYNAAMHSLEQARRATQRLTRQSYLAVISGISQVTALDQAVTSSETALKATNAGFEVGTRTTIDVVVSQRTTSEAHRNYSQAKYNYILNVLKLKQAAGTLSPEDIQLINSWLIK